MPICVVRAYLRSKVVQQSLDLGGVDAPWRLFHLLAQAVASEARMVEVGQRRSLGLLLSSTEEEGHGGFPVRQPLQSGLYRVEEQVVGVARIVGGAQQVFASLDAQGLDDLQSAADVGIDRAPTSRGMPMEWTNSSTSGET